MRAVWGKTSPARMIALALMKDGWEPHQCTTPEQILKSFPAHVAVVQASLGVPLLFAGALVNAVGPWLVFGLAAVLMLTGVVTLVSERRTT